ncbi:MAG: peptidoglycan-binding domain-containing protein [Geminicoccaceae bacterium]
MRIHQSLARLNSRFFKIWPVACALTFGSLVITSGLSEGTPAVADGFQQSAHELAGSQDVDLPVVGEDETSIDATMLSEQSSFLLPSEVMDPIVVRRQIQETLISLGGFDSTVDGNFGPRTERAIRAFQESLGVPRTGQLSDWQVIELFKRAASLHQEFGLRQLIDNSAG